MNFLNNEYGCARCENWPKITEYIQMFDRPFSFTKRNGHTSDTWRADFVIEKYYCAFSLNIVLFGDKLHSGMITIREWVDKKKNNNFIRSNISFQCQFFPIFNFGEAEIR